MSIDFRPIPDTYMNSDDSALTDHVGNEIAVAIEKLGGAENPEICDDIHCVDSMTNKTGKRIVRAIEKLVEDGIIGGVDIDPEDVTNAVNKYLEKNPVQPYDDSELRSVVSSLVYNTGISSEEVISGVDHVRSYINNHGAINALADHDYYVVTSYKVNAGDSVFIYGKAGLNGSYPIASFSENEFANGVKTSLIVAGSEKVTDYSVPFIAQKDGYIYIASVAQPGKGKLNLYKQINIRDLSDEIAKWQAEQDYEIEKATESLDYGPIDASEIQMKRYAGKYISTSPYGINSIDKELFVIHKAQVQAGKTYRLHGYTRLAANVYPIASFSNIDVDVAPVNSSSVIIKVDNPTASQWYDVKYYADSDGFIYTASFDTDNYVHVTECKIVSRSIYKLTGTTNETVKIQMFGDSITDDFWRSDHTTWATLLPEYIPQRKIAITNSAVGGSGIGHGHSDTARYAELQYNYVHDLITNTDIFEPDSDIFIMFVGTNNWAGNGQLGEWGDSTVGTFYGAARLICEHITSNTDALFFVCTPCGRFNSADEARGVDADGTPVNGQGKTLRDYCDALVKTCNFYGVPVIDLNYELGWNRYNIRRFCQDGLHPNPDSSRWIAQLVAGEIKKHLGI